MLHRLLARVPEEQGSEGVARARDKLAAPGTGAAALLVRAQLPDKIGNAKRATAPVDEAMSRLPADASPLTRLRFVSALATTPQISHSMTACTPTSSTMNIKALVAPRVWARFCT